MLIFIAINFLTRCQL